MPNFARIRVGDTWIGLSTLGPYYATDSDDQIQLEYRDYNLVPDGGLVRFYAGAGDDEFYGEGAFYYGGPGNDTFYNGGTDDFDRQFLGYQGPAIAHGGLGNDRFFDSYGDTNYYGGPGSDYFTTVGAFAGVSQAQEGDVDRVWLGSGDDLAHVAATWWSTADGYIYIPRRVIVDGGQGFDTLIMERSPNWYLGDASIGTHLNMRDAATGLTYANGTMLVSGFEQYIVLYSDPTIERVTLGRYDDTFIYNGNSLNDRDQSIRYFGGAGDDLIIGAEDFSRNVMRGGPGDDVLISRGGNSETQTDVLLGGTGDDILFSRTHAITHGNVIMHGGPGRDIFVVGQGYSQSIRILDFDPDEDIIMIDHNTHLTGFTGITADQIREEMAYLQSGEIDVWYFDDPNDYTMTEQNGRVLIWGPDYLGAGEAPTVLKYAYSSNSGALYIARDQSDPYGTPELLVVLDGAPDLTADHFVIL